MPSTVSPGGKQASFHVHMPLTFWLKKEITTKILTAFIDPVEAQGCGKAIKLTSPETVLIRSMGLVLLTQSV